jgi:hypothetical protein
MIARIADLLDRSCRGTAQCAQDDTPRVRQAEAGRQREAAQRFGWDPMLKKVPYLSKEQIEGEKHLKLGTEFSDMHRLLAR